MADLYKRTEYLLYNYKTIKAEIKNIDLEMRNMEYVGVGAISYEEKSAPTNLFNSSVENEVVNREKAQYNLERLKKSKEIMIETIDNALETLSPRELEIIKIRYFDRVSNKKMGIRLDLSEPHLCKLKKGIIEKLTKIINIC